MVYQERYLFFSLRDGFWQKNIPSQGKFYSKRGPKYLDFGVYISVYCPFMSFSKLLI